MIPGKILRFLEYASISCAATHDKDLVPSIHRASGYSVDPDKETMNGLIPEQFAINIISSLEDNGQFALTIEHIPSHETYQFKGDYIDSRPATPDDLVHYEQLKGRFIADVRSLYGLDEDVTAPFSLEPSIVVRFKVREIFLQTPGPGAGSRIFPPEAR